MHQVDTSHTHLRTFQRNHRHSWSTDVAGAHAANIQCKFTHSVYCRYCSGVVNVCSTADLWGGGGLIERGIVGSRKMRSMMTKMPQWILVAFGKMTCQQFFVLIPTYAAEINHFPQNWVARGLCYEDSLQNARRRGSQIKFLAPHHHKSSDIISTYHSCFADHLPLSANNAATLKAASMWQKTTTMAGHHHWTMRGEGYLAICHTGG